jgi:DNA-binding CsgD family transcriptional regulator
MDRGGSRLRGAIRDAAETSPDDVVFRQRALAALGESVPFDAACLALADPATMLPTSLTTVGYDDPGTYAAVFDIEYGTGDEPGRLETLRGLGIPVRTLREATAGRVRSCRYFVDVLAPHGLRDEVRMLLRGRNGLVWGGCTMARSRGAVFSDAEVALLGSVLAEVGDGLRTTLFRASVQVLPDSPSGPAVAVVTADDELAYATDAALDWLARLGWGAVDRPVALLPGLAAATGLRRSGRSSATLRTRTRDGEWVVIRAGWQAPESGGVVLTIERAHLPEVASLAALAHGLTRREAEVLAHLLAGDSREEIAQALVISPWTVQDHLRSIYAKTGTSGRRGLVSLLVRTEYLPRLGGPVGPDGWFAGEPAAGAGARRST